MRQRIVDALWGLFAGDALAMPAHWYYSIDNIRRDFDGGVRRYEAPPHPHPEAFMVGMAYRPDVEAANRLGRPYDILHDHARFYDATFSPLDIDLSDRESEHGNAVAAADQRYHYHHGLQRGDNTLGAHLVRVLLRSITTHGRYDQDRFLAEFVEHLAEPGRNRDPYTEIYIRRWFENWTRGVPAYAAADYQRNVWSIGSHGGLIRPLVLALNYPSDYQAVGMAVEHHNLTHRSENNIGALSVMIPLIRALVSGADPRSAVARAAARLRLPTVTGEELYAEYRAHGGPGGIPREQMWRYHTELSNEPFDLEAVAAEHDEERLARSVFATACYPEHGIPLLLTLAHRADYETEPALLANTNAGGDNVHRGMIMGLVVGAAHGVPEHLRHGLADAAELETEIESFADIVTTGTGA